MKKLFKLKALCFALLITVFGFTSSPPDGGIIIIEQGLVVGNDREITFKSQIEEDLVICILHENGEKEVLRLKGRQKKKKLLKMGRKYELVHCNPEELIKKFKVD